MDVREKLVELFYKAEEQADKRCDFAENCDKCPANNPKIDCMDWLKADCLLSLGVMVQEWISVKDERKPKAGEDVLVVVFDGYDTYTDTDCLMRDGKWCFETENHKVTHWQPMPQPPKGE